MFHLWGALFMAIQPRYRAIPCASGDLGCTPVDPPKEKCLVNPNHYEPPIL